MITTLIDGCNASPVLGNSKVSRSVKDASAPNFADAMQNLSTEREPVSSSVVDEDSVSPAVSQEHALSSELRDEPDPNELQHAMDESTMDMIKSGSADHSPDHEQCSSAENYPQPTSARGGWVGWYSPSFSVRCGHKTVRVLM